MRSFRCLVQVAAFLATAAAAVAQEPAAQGARQAPVTALKPETFALPPSAYDTNKFNYTPPQPGSGGLKPGQLDLGDSVLQFDARRNTPSGVGIEAIDPKRLGGIRKDDTKPLNYFGMTLSTPLN